MAASSYPSPAEATIVAQCEKLMHETMARYDPSHDAYHVNRVRKTALSLACSMTPTPDLLVIELAALLHDVLDKKYLPVDQKDVDAYTFFLPYFREWVEISRVQPGTNEETGNADLAGLDFIADGRARTITKIVESVSWTTERKLRAMEPSGWTQWHENCVELHCVQDADRLDAIGAFGVMRCAAFSCAVKRPLHTPPNDPMHEESSIAHFHDKLLHVISRLKTKEGKRRGQRRHQFMLDFLSAVDEEYEGTS